DVRLLEHKVSGRGTGGDRTEEAIAAGHAAELWLRGGLLAVRGAVQEADGDVGERQRHEQADVARDDTQDADQHGEADRQGQALAGTRRLERRAERVTEALVLIEEV